MLETMHHDRTCHCRECLWRRNAERADQYGPEVAATLEAAILKCDAEFADIDSNTRVYDDADHAIGIRYGFRFDIALDLEEPRRQLHTLARVFRAIAAEMEKEHASIH